LKHLDGEYPIEWLYQIQHYLGITGYSYAYLFIYERDSCQYYEPILIERDKEFVQQNMNALVEWWQEHMEGDGRRPEPINGEDALLLYPESGSHLTIEASPDDYQLYQELLSIRERVADLKKMEDSLATKLKCSMEDAERLVLAGRTLISWKSVESNRFDSKAFRQEHPELYNQFKKPIQTRRFSVK
jgi:predicted phage-related endonuclease